MPDQGFYSSSACKIVGERLDICCYPHKIIHRANVHLMPTMR